MNKKELEFLLEGKKDLLQMGALKQKGLAKIRIQKFKEGVFNTILEVMING